jgi:polysaccharide export outer membrane protein
MEINPMKHNQLCALFLAAGLLFCATAAFAQADLQQRINAAAAYSPSRPRADVATAMHSSGLAVVPEDFALLKLGPGFLVSVSILSDSDFDGPYRVDQQGDIALPVLGSVHVAGETVSDARAQIVAKLVSGQILKDPQVTLNVLEYTVPEVTISGEVASPGKYPLLAPHRLSEALALAGGTTLLAAGDVDVTRAGHPGSTIVAHYARGGDTLRNDDVLVYPGDSIQVRRAGVVYVLGAVTRPGGYVMQENGSLNLLQAISLANGTIFTASLRTFYILRRNPDGSEVNIDLPYKEIVAGKAADVQLRASDILYVPTSGPKSFLMNTQGLMAATASSTIYGVLVH